MLECLYFFLGKNIIRRWTNLRDSYVKWKRNKSNKKSGSERKTPKKYVFSDQLQFLSNVYDARETEDSIQSQAEAGLERETITYRETEVSADRGEDSSNSLQSNSILKSKKRKKLDEVEMKMLKALEADKPCSKTSFLLSLKPHLDKFDEQDYLQFQLGVLKVIESINEKKKGLLIQPPPLCQYSSAIPYQHQFYSSAMPYSAVPQQLSHPQVINNQEFAPPRNFRATQINVIDQDYPSEGSNIGSPIIKSFDSSETESIDFNIL